MTDTWLIYGANGYTGTLLAEEAVRRGHAPLLAGRSRAALEPLSRRLGLEYRVVGLEDPAALVHALAGVRLVLHAAGPFVHTAQPMLDACLAAHASYVDITGELPVFQAAYALDAAARAAGITIMPGAGFDVVPSDCLCKHVAELVPHARRLELAVLGIGSPSAGTLKSVIEALPSGACRRADGRLVPVPMGKGGRRVQMPRGPQLAMPMPIADLETAFRSTGIPDITTYFVMPGRSGRRLARIAPLLPLLTRPALVRRALGALVERRVTGPDAEARARGRSWLWARAEDEAGTGSEAWLETPEGYALTAVAGVRVVERLLAAPLTGAYSPAQAFGADFVLELPGTRRLSSLEAAEEE
jgi:short subunit dehydrogenase-like uncharacterized protein